METKIGLDPEFLVRNTSGKIICPAEFSKKLKKFIPATNKKLGGFNRDGMAVEFNPTPSDSPEVLSRTVQLLYAEAREKLSQFGGELTPQIGANIYEEGDESTFTHDVKVGGCDPDFNAYTMEINSRRIDYNTYPYRFCGGHIHMTAPFLRSWEEACIFIQSLKPLGEFLGTLEDGKWSKLRREAYGQEGDFRWRPEESRIEYRTPDASWIWEDIRSGKAMKEVFKIINNTVQQFA